MIVIEINGTKCNMPTSWHDLNVEQGQALMIEMAKPEWSDYLYRFAYYSGLNYTELKDSDIEVDELATILELISWDGIPLEELIINTPKSIRFFDASWINDWTIRVPQTSDFFRDRKAFVPKVAATQPVGSKIMFDQYVLAGIKETGNIFSTIHLAVAVYMQPLYFDGKFDGDQVDQLAEICKRCNFIEALSVATFFLSKHQSLHGWKMKDSSTSQTQGRQGQISQTFPDLDLSAMHISLPEETRQSSTSL